MLFKCLTHITNVFGVNWIEDIVWGTFSFSFLRMGLNYQDLETQEGTTKLTMECI